MMASAPSMTQKQSLQQKVGTLDGPKSDTFFNYIDIIPNKLQNSFEQF